MKNINIKPGEITAWTDYNGLEEDEILETLKELEEAEKENEQNGK